ncbi:hypothetical protein [Bradyrhizobium sp. DASA03120]|uniref:hypothetical protein n=1 Tax=Bradyrhizobium sp. SMVTL-02 TaxID=3395917 RepID=UPI003F72733F
MAIVNITCENDADFARQFAYQLTDGTPVDLTGNTMKMGIRRRAEDVTEEMLLTTENGGLTITDPPNGKFTVLITQAQLVQLDLGDYEHSLIRIRGTQRMRIWSGTLVNNAGASR